MTRDLSVSITIPAHLVVGVGGEEEAKGVILRHMTRAEREIMARIKRRVDLEFKPIAARGPKPGP